MSAYAWFTMDKINDVERRLIELRKSFDLSIGSPIATAEIVDCMMELIKALKKDPGPTISHDM